MHAAHVPLTDRRRQRSSSILVNFLHIVKKITIGIFILILITIGIFGYLLRVKINHLRNSHIVFVSTHLDGRENLISLVKVVDDQPTTVTFNDELQVPVGKHGQYRLDAVYPLLKQEKYTDAQIASFYSFIFGQVVDTVISLPVENGERLDSQVWLGVRQGTVSVSDAIAIWWLFRSLATEESSTHITQWSQWNRAREQLFDPPLIPNCSLAIVNSTDQSGLAQAFNAVLESEGVEIIRLGSQSEAREKSALYRVDESCEEVVEVIKTLSPVALEVEVSQLPTAEYRAALLLVIGEDIAAFNPQRPD
ncbi:MAG TPA: LytR C-terminal domain-containing protein [Patescibacteria group bacterium]